jgi:serine/threonine-protein kinase
MGQVLLKQGRFTEARAATRRCLDLLPADRPQQEFTSQQLRLCERLIPVEGKLPALLKGEARPRDAAERLALADLCRQYKRLYAAATRFYAGAFAGQPKLADDPRQGHRYNAACAAALAAAGQGQDADQLDGKGRARLRRQALDWLRADLAAWARVVEKDPAQSRPELRRTLAHWQKDPDLAALRDQAALAKLPEAEREAWRKLWAEVRVLLRPAQGKP